MPSFRHFLHTQLVLKIPEPTASFASKTAIVTGANGGFGREIIKHLIRLEASKIICACRSVSKGEEVKREIEAVSKCNPDIIEVWPLDLESPSSIKAFVERANALSRLDVLINLAGVLCVNFSIVYDTERTMAVNAIGTFLLAVQMIPKLKETARKYSVTPHMTFVASALYDVAKYPEDPGDDIFAYFKDEKNFAAQNQYNLSKLFQLYAAIKLSALVHPLNTKDTTPIVINSVDPCFCKTGLGFTNAKIDGPKLFLAKIGFSAFAAVFARSPEEGSRLIVQAAATGKESHGAYLRAGEVQEYAPIALDQEKAKYIWDLLSKRLEDLEPGILQNLT